MLHLVCLTLALLAAFAMPAPAQEPYPTRPITIIVPFPPAASLTSRPGRSPPR